MSFSKGTESLVPKSPPITLITPIMFSWAADALPLMELKSERKSVGGAPPPMPGAPVARPPVLVPTINARVMTSDQLAAKIGHQPHADRLCGRWKRSSNYKAMREEITAVEDAGRQRLDTLDGFALVGLRDSLDGLIKAAGAYAEQHKTKDRKKGAAADVVASVQGQKAALQAVRDDPDYARVKAHMTVNQALDCKARGISFADCEFDKLNDSNMSKPDDNFGAGMANSVSKIDYKDGKVRVFKAEKLREDKPLDACTAIGIDPAAPRNGNRNVATFAISDLLGVSVTPKVSYGLHANPKTGETEIGLMIALAPGKQPGVKIEKPFNPLPGGNKYALLQADNQAELAKLGIIKKPTGEYVELAGGLGKLWDAPPSREAQAALQEQLNGLDWSDVLTGQADRHPSNYLVDIQGDKVTVTGIDNDVCFGKKQGNAAVAKSDVNGRTTPPGLPPLMDQKIYDNLHAADFDRNLRPKLASLLTKEEVDASKSRFDEAKAYAEELKRTGYVVEDWNDWRSPTDPQLSAAQLLAEGAAAAAKAGAAAKTSGGLFGRDFAKFFTEDGLL
jgi:hypothetical protein